MSDGNWSGPPCPVGNSSDDEDEDFISFTSSDAEYFATANLDTLEDVAAAIQSCKQSILETTENTRERKTIVNRLIQLQIRQQDLKEKQEMPDSTFETSGHAFVNYVNGITIPGNDFNTAWADLTQGNLIY